MEFSEVPIEPSCSPSTDGFRHQSLLLFSERVRCCSFLSVGADGWLGAARRVAFWHETPCRHVFTLSGSLDQVTHEVKHVLWMYLNTVAILCYKAGARQAGA
eukprot:scaffold212300_cov41-Tisochrysis_lutea.AAC.2